MSEVAVRQQTALAITPDQTEFNAAQVATLHQLGVVNADRANLAVFFHQATRTGLDPFAKQIYMIARKSSEWDPVRQEKVQTVKYTIQTGIDGYRLIARRAAAKAKVALSFEDTLWCGPDGVWVDAWVYDYNPTAAKVTVYRGKERFSHVSLWREYVQTFYNSKVGAHVPNSMWSKMPANQLAKTAEAGALRKAFPQDLSGMYVEDEMPESESTVDDVVEDVPETMQRRTVQTGAQQPQEPPAPEPADDVVEEPPTDDTAGDTVQQAAEAAFAAVMQAQTITEPADAAEAATAPDEADNQPATEPRRRKLNTLLRPKFEGPGPASDWMSEQIGRRVTSTAELTVIECEQLIGALTE